MSRITTSAFPGPAGDLEYLLNEWTPAAPDGPAAPLPRGHDLAAVVCHPHPLFGGTMHSRTAFYIARALEALGMPVLRFNFRGVGKSQGAYDEGAGERADLRAALDFMTARFARRMVLAGFSFGSMVAIRHLAAVADPRVVAYLGVGVPADREALPRPWAWQGPKLLISGTEDQFASPANLQAAARQLPAPCALFLLPGADHYLTGRYDEFAALVHAHLLPP